MIKTSIRVEDKIIINIYVLNRAPKYMKQKLTELKEEIYHSTITVGEIHIKLSIMDYRTAKQKTNKETEDYSSTIMRVNGHL